MDRPRLALRKTNLAPTRRTTGPQMKRSILHLPPREQERQEHNMQDLSQFFPMLFGNEVSMPEELANEPYSYYDNHLRPEIIVPRAKLVFLAYKHKVECVVGDKTIRRDIASEVPGKSLEKYHSDISVVTVYDTYGLEVAYAYLKHLYYYKYDKNYSSWLQVYLQGSLAGSLPNISGRDPASTGGVLYLCSLMMAGLVALDNQLKMMGSLQPSDIALPSELLSKILVSERISKQLTSSIRSNKCITIPSLKEMEDRDRSPVTLRFDADTWILNYRVRHVRYQWSMTHESLNEYILEHSSGGAVLNLTLGVNVDIEQYSIYDYADVLASKGCDKNESLRLVLRDILNKFSIVTEDNVSEVCTWIVQLSYDTKEVGTEKRFYSFNELRDEVQRLVSKLI